MQTSASSSQYLNGFSRVTVLPGLLIGAASLLMLAGCNSKAGAQSPGQGAPQAVPVPVVEVQPKPFELTFEYPAQISGVREVEIRPRVSGIIEKRLFEEGGRVKQGQSLYKLDNAPYETALAKALADQKTADVQAAQAKRDFNRIEPLIASKAVSQAEYDNAKSAVELAQANQAVAASRVREARLNLGYARVESPVSGYVSRSLKTEGSLVTGPQDLLTTVTQVDKVYANFGMPEGDNTTLREGLANGNIQLDKGGLKVEILNSEGKPNGMQARLAFQDVRVNTSTGTVDARALFDNKNDALSPGQFVRVRVSGAVEKNTILLPQRAVIESPMGGKIVMTVDKDSKVAPRPVKVAQWSGDQWVITSGLNAGDKVITDGYIKTPPGTPVAPQMQAAGNADQQAAPAAAPAAKQ